MTVVSIDPDSIEVTGTAIRLIGGRCGDCGEIAFPRQDSCRRCGADGMAAVGLADRGVLWSWTVQRYQPPDPPYLPRPGEFEPFGVGYVELPGEVIVETLLTDTARLAIGMPMRLTRLTVPGRNGDCASTFAFTPDEQGDR